MDWRTAMRERAISVRQVLLRHPWANGLMGSRANPGPATLRHHDAFTLTELTLPFRKPGDVAEVAGNILEGFRNGEYPYLAEMAMDRAMKPGYNYGDEFEYGLDLILDGITRVNRREP
jgi:Tetracyclin repressor-like, C-terminal domain